MIHLYKTNPQINIQCFAIICIIHSYIELCVIPQKLSINVVITWYTINGWDVLDTKIGDFPLILW